MVRMVTRGSSENLNGSVQQETAAVVQEDQTKKHLNIAREFVRQYYTMLSMEPEHVHRFYSDDSIFMRTSQHSECPVRGQKAIQQELRQMNFNACRAKIHSIKCSQTVSNSLLIQVVGELSNNQKEGRRFMQSFVLCPQGPKKFYALNDILCYVDEAVQSSDGGPPTHKQADAVATTGGADGQKHDEIIEKAPVTSKPPPSVAPNAAAVPPTHDYANGKHHDDGAEAAAPQNDYPHATTSTATDVTASTTTTTAPAPLPPRAPRGGGGGPADASVVPPPATSNLPPPDVSSRLQPQPQDPNASTNSNNFSQNEPHTSAGGGGGKTVPPPSTDPQQPSSAAADKAKPSANNAHTGTPDPSPTPAASQPPPSSATAPSAAAAAATPAPVATAPAPVVEPTGPKTWANIAASSQAAPAPVAQPKREPRVAAQPPPQVHHQPSAGSVHSATTTAADESSSIAQSDGYADNKPFVGGHGGLGQCPYVGKNLSQAFMKSIPTNDNEVNKVEHEFKRAMKAIGADLSSARLRLGRNELMLAFAFVDFASPQAAENCFTKCYSKAMPPSMGNRWVVDLNMWGSKHEIIVDEKKDENKDRGGYGGGNQRGGGGGMNAGGRLQGGAQSQSGGYGSRGGQGADQGGKGGGYQQGRGQGGQGRRQHALSQSSQSNQ